MTARKKSAPNAHEQLDELEHTWVEDTWVKGRAVHHVREWRGTAARAVHHVAAPDAPMRPAILGERFAWTTCFAKVIRAYATDDLDKVTCSRCLDRLAKDTKARLKGLVDP